jgi:hypothetical protein
MRREGWLVFAAWVLAGAFAVFSLLAAASIGLFVAPVAGVAIWLALRLGRRWPETLGIISGAGAVCLLIAFLDSVSTSWLVAGLVLVAGGAIPYVLARRGTTSKGGRAILDAQDTPT